MCLFKKRKIAKQVPSSYKYPLGSTVGFKHKGDFTRAYVYEVYLNDDGQVVYDLQLGGECPSIIKGIEESKIREIK